MMAESSDDGEHSDWTLLHADNADAILQTQVDTEDEKEKEPSAMTMSDQVSTIESSGIEVDLVAEDGDEEAKSDTTASIRSHSSNFCHIHADELLDAEVHSEASADSISVIPDDQDLHMDLSNFSSFSSTNCELPTDLNVTRQRAYTHVPNRKLNITLNLVLALSFTMVVGLGIGHFLGWSTKWEQTVATIQTMKVQELHDDLIECMSRPVTQDDDHDNVCAGEFQQDSDACQATADSGVDEELLEEFNELKRSLHVRQQELESALNTIEEAQMKEKSSLDRLRQLEEENQELKSLVDEEIANDQMEREMADKLRSENVQLKEDLARLREELAAEMAEDDQFGQPDDTNDAVVGSFREQMNQLEIENEDLRRVIAKLRYVDHPNVEDHEQDSEATVTTSDSTESMDSSNPGTTSSEDASLGDLLHSDDLNSIIEEFLTITKQKYYRDGHSHVSLMDGLKAYKSVFAKIASMSSSLNSEQIIGKVETTLRDSLDTLEKMGLDIKGRLSEIWVSNKQEDVAQEEEETQQIKDDGGCDEVSVEKSDTNILQQDDSVNNEANSNDDKGEMKSEKENIGMVKENAQKQSKEKENKISKDKDSSKILKEQNHNKASKEKEKIKVSKEKDSNKVSKEKDSNKVSKEKDSNKVSKENDNKKVSKENNKNVSKEKDSNKVSKENNKVSKEKDSNKVSKEKDSNKVSKEKESNKVSKEKDNNKVSKEKNDKVSKGKEKMAKNKENSNVPKEEKQKDSKKRENKIPNENNNKNPETSKKREKTSDKKHDRRRRESEKAVKNSKDSVEKKDKNEATSETHNKDDKQHTKKANEDKITEDAKNKRNKKKSNKSSENSTESSGGMWMFERANQRETKRNKDREAEWYFERKHHERKKTESKKYENRKKKHNEKDDEDDDEKIKYRKDWKKEEKKSSEGKNYRDEDDDEHHDGDAHGMNWHANMLKSFQKYKKHFKQRWTSFKKNWDIPKVQHPSSYFQHFYKSQ